MSQSQPDEKGPTPPPFRLAPPEGQRLARGQKLPELESIESSSDDSQKREKKLVVNEPLFGESLAGDESALQSVSSDDSSGDDSSSDDSSTDDSSSDDSSTDDSSTEFSTQSEAQIEQEYKEAERFRLSTLRDDTPRDQELGLLEHLTELRTRLMWCFAIVGLGTVVTWKYGLTLQEWFAAPINEVLKGKGKIISRGPTDFFTIYLEFTLAAAVILTAPLLFFQMWRFIEPALTNSERRYTLVLVPFSSVLFFLGAGLGYFVSPFFFQFFLGFQPAGVAADWDYKDSLMLMAKMLIVFGVMFQVPIVIIFGVKIGILTRNLLIQYWRHAVVLIFTICAVLTPTWDPVTLAFCAGPPCLLYALSIWLVKWL